MSVPIISVAHCFMAVVNIAYVCCCDANMTAEKNSPSLKRKKKKTTAGRKSTELNDGCVEKM